MMKMTQFCSARRFLAFACLSSALIAGSAVSALAHAALNFRVYSSLPADDSSAHYIWFSRFQENINNNAKLKGQIILPMACWAKRPMRRSRFALAQLI